MNGQRSPSPRQTGASSLDALSRTIEGLEARIEGLMGTLPRETRAERPPLERHADTRSPGADVPRPDPLAEIRERQRALEAARPRFAAEERRAERPREIEPRSALREGSLAPQTAAVPVAEAGPELGETLTRELQSLRAEIREIRDLARHSRESGDMREDMARVTAGLDRLEEFARPEARGLRADVEQLRSLIDGLAREDSLRQMEDRFHAVEARLETVEPERIQKELLSLAYRLDDIKHQLSSIGDVRSVRLLEDKLIAIATALEHIGAHLEPNGRAVLEQFSLLDERLNEISRAIASNRGAPATDPRLVERLEERIALIAHHLELISEQTAERGEAEQLAERIEFLTQRIEDLANQQAAERLSERLDELTAMLNRPQTTGLEPEITGYLSDISRKIDALDGVGLSDRLADQIAIIARRIDDIERQPVPVMDQHVLQNLDDRLYSIAARLDETVSAPSADMAAIAGLEQQIAHLSALISAQPFSGAADAPALDGRLAKLEDYLATSDEYIVEAARQAAEAVMDNYARQAPAASDQTAETLALVAGHLRQLEDISRGSEERSHRTFEALHQTLVQIAEKLEQMDRRAAPPAGPAAGVTDALPNAEPSPVKAAHREIEAAFQTPAEREAAVEPVDAPVAADIVTTPGADEIKVRASLLAGLGRKLAARAKKTDTPAEPVTVTRQAVDPAPSIDPADVIPPEEANELLEPGSGTPDVRRILEKVRARQAEQAAPARGPAAAARGDDKMDIIAAARRAAQAAAQEAERGARTARKPLAREVEGQSASAFARYRRPILMAVGALLLAAMVLPLAKSLTQGSPAPQVVEPPAASQPAPAQTENAVPQAESKPEAVTRAALAPLDNRDTPTAPPAPGVSSVGSANLSPAPLSGTVPDSFAPKADPQTPQAAAPSPSQPAAFEVPAEIAPASLAAAAASGQPAALYELGARYQEGRGVTADFTKAAIWYQRAADQGLAPAQYRLAGLYEKGTGVPRDVVKAKALYDQAAKAGNASAMHNLAVLYASGADGKPDMQAAAEWFAKAADLGIADSQFNLAVLYAQGSGVKADLERSYTWFAIAAKGGDKDAQAKSDELGRALKPEQLQRARAVADGWAVKPQNPDANSVNLPDAWQGQGVTTGSVDMEKAIRNIQAILNRNGFDAGKPDGKLGARTVAAIKAFQTSVGQQPTGRVSNDLVKALLARNS
ncbi:peptidoglycan-binding protein [Rhizobium paknamense]|uniref:Localization factor PodJL n=1 Tax=Rhizobium paknamense TaxID=1206817 RepID=A0ABU0IF89_9HYPH|nr:peptidoglycan-binding protein [Rhizobium paknamense]MDQ0456910.1 localization factor PodJL [Rhizobium paknamense]